MDNDILYCIMLQADLKTLKQLCVMDKHTHQVCQSLYFWQQKYQNHYPILKTLKTGLDWRGAYCKMNRIHHFLDQTFSLLDHTLYESIDLYITYHNLSQHQLTDHMLLTYFPSSFLKSINEMNFIGYYDNRLLHCYYYRIKKAGVVLYLSTSDHHKNMVDTPDEDMSLFELKQLLLSTLYLYNNYTVKISFDD